MKKTSLLVISIILIFSQLSLSNLPVYANSDSEEDYVTMDVDKGVSIWRYKGLSKDIVIPSEIKGKPVVEIGGFAFSDMSLKSVKIPSSVTTIGFKAFNNNLLENVEIPSSVTTIGDAAFSANRLTSVEISSSVKTISKAAFYSNQLTSVKIPSSVTTIGEDAFSRNNLANVEIPSSVTTIGMRAFQFNQLTKVDIPSSVTTIEKGAFGYNQLTSVEIPSSVKIIGTGAFSRNKLNFVIFHGTPQLDSDYSGGPFSYQFKDNDFFKGWFEDPNLTIKWTESVSQPMTIYSEWKKSYYNVNFDSNGGSEVSAKVVLEKELLPSPATPLKDGHTFAGWYKDKELSEAWDFAKEVVTKNITLYAKWTKDEIPETSYTITFDSNGGSEVASEEVKEGELVKTPTVPTKEGYAFAGWYKDKELSEAWDFAKDVVTKNVTLYAKWTKDETSELSYTVTFNSNGGSEVSAKEVVEGELLPSPATPVKDGNTFVGWYKDEELSESWDFAKEVVTKNITLYAKWTKDETSELSYTVTFASNGGSEVSAKVVLEKELLPSPATPLKDGHTFAGWYKDKELSEAWDFAKAVVTKNITLYAKWTKDETSELSYTVTFDSNGGSEVSAKVVLEKELLPSPATPLKDGHTFASWYKDVEHTTVWDFTKDRVVENITLYAKWTKDNTSEGGSGGSTPSYTVAFDSNGGSKVSSQTVAYRELLKVPSNPAREGYIFTGWFKDKELITEWDFAKDEVTSNTTLYAKWTKDNTSEPRYTVIFDSNGGNRIPSQTVSYRELLKAPSNPAKEGHIFAGWFKDAELTTTWDFTKDAVTENLTLYAKWNKESKECQTTFKDIDNNWAKDMIEEIASRCIIKGYPDGTFRPNDMIQRQHVVLIIERALPLTPLRESVSFLDVPHSHPYYQQITLLQQAGIIDGSNGAFRPNAYITRAQMAKIMVLAFGLTPEGNSTFKDVNPSHWASGYIATLADHNIALGDENGHFRPNENLTRAQFTAFMYRALGL
ncbi:InlB B-repeat-containing protein [Lysinibacillus sp. NPDC094403]|uniref:InlB B-repeat-containing protein n=1 Tax=Lysinibacillus sp. NPDC094403 TaxID=3390581 RepID=UPI003D03086D